MASRLHRLLPSVLLLLGVCFGVSGIPCSADALTLTRGPSIWQRTETSARIAWQTDTPTEGTVRYGRTGGLGEEVSDSGTKRNHSVTLSGLRPGTRYFYRIRAGSESLNESGQFFETAPSAAEPFRFVAFGDLGRVTDPQVQIASLVEGMEPDLAILTGDIVYESGEPQNFTSQYFRVYRPTLARVPFYPTLGNHDVVTESGQPYLDAFYLPEGPGNERYYSFDYSNAHFVCLEVTAEGVKPGRAMLAWLDADLGATTKKWKFVFFHVPMYSNLGAHGDDPVIAAALDPILSAHEVDLVLQGHNHFYSRTYPVSHGEDVAAGQDPRYVNPGAPIYIVTGGGGRTLEPVARRGAHEVTAKSTYHVVSVDVRADRLTLRAVDRAGTVFDSITLTKHGASGSVALTLAAVSPNPSTGPMSFRFLQSEAANVRLTVYDVTGRRVREISTAGPLSAGSNVIQWDGLDRHGRAAPAGVYLARIEAGRYAVTAKLIRISGR